jgi:CO/xanthine dehydrogenase Mo-binding subunit
MPCCDPSASGCAVWTAADIADLPPIDFRDPAAEALRPYRQPLLARERLRYVGEPIAAVLATDPYLAEDGAELISVEAEVLTLILDASAAPTSFAPGLSPQRLKALLRAAARRGRPAGRRGTEEGAYDEQF